jgi:hypothetical protein
MCCLCYCNFVDRACKHCSKSFDLKKQWQWQKLERKRGDELEREKGGEVEERRCFGLTLIYLVII